jgi:hypothetical protein
MSPDTAFKPLNPNGFETARNKSRPVRPSASGGPVLPAPIVE